MRCTSHGERSVDDLSPFPQRRRCGWSEFLIGSDSKALLPSLESRGVRSRFFQKSKIIFQKLVLSLFNVSVVSV